MRGSARAHVRGEAVPDLLAQFHVVSIEREYVRALAKPVLIWPHDDQRRGELHTATRVPLHFMSRPDAVLLNRANHEIEVLIL